MPKRGLKKSRKTAVQDGLKVIEIDPVFAEMRLQFRVDF